MEKSPNKRKQRRLETREKLFRAAMGEFRRVGVSEAQIGPIAKAAGVSRGSFYFHFPTKDDVLLEAFRRGEEAVHRRLENLKRSPKDVREALTLVCNQLLRVVEAREEPDPMREAWALIARHRSDVNWNEHYFGTLTRYFEKAQASGEICAELDPRDLTKLFLRSLFGSFTVPGLSKAERKREIETLRDIFLNGICTARPTGAKGRR